MIHSRVPVLSSFVIHSKHLILLYAVIHSLILVLSGGLIHFVFMILSDGMIHSADIDTFFGSDSFVVNGTFVKLDSLPAHDTV